MEEAKDEVREIIEFLKNPRSSRASAARIPRGVLLVGRPGCGKTLLAKAIAGEAEVPFFSISGSDFVEMFVGVGASRVRDLFKQARENEPVHHLPRRDRRRRSPRGGTGMGGGHDEREQTLNAILVEMDGFDTDEGIIVIAATNRPTCSTRRCCARAASTARSSIDLPDVKGREEILKVHAQEGEDGPRRRPGEDRAATAGLLRRRPRRDHQRGRDPRGAEQEGRDRHEDLEEAREKVRYGRQKKLSQAIELEDKKITAYHEAGHTVVCRAGARSA
jgi:cell division protease FtsH